MSDFLINWITITPSFAVPFALAALGLIITEKSGVLSLGAEGFMLVGAMTGAGTVLLLGGQPGIALMVSALSSSALSIVFAVMVVTLRVNQVVAGLTIVFLGQGLSGLISDEQGWTSRPFSGLQPLRFGPLTDIPVIGHAIFGQDPLVYLALAIFAFVVWVLARTPIGLKLRAVGDSPDAADAAGVNISLYRYGATMIGSALVGLAGGYLSVGVAKIWVDDMVSVDFTLRTPIEITRLQCTMAYPIWPAAGGKPAGQIYHLEMCQFNVVSLRPAYKAKRTPRSALVQFDTNTLKPPRAGCRAGQPQAPDRAAAPIQAECASAFRWWMRGPRRPRTREQ